MGRRTVRASPFPLLVRKRLCARTTFVVIVVHAFLWRVRCARLGRGHSRRVGGSVEKSTPVAGQNAKRTKDMFHQEDENFLEEVSRVGEKVRCVFIERRERCVSRRDVVERSQREGEVVAGIRVAVCFTAVKASENALCSDVLFQSLRDDVDSSEDSLKSAIEIALAGNLFDAGAAQAVQNVVAGARLKEIRISLRLRTGRIYSLRLRHRGNE